MLPPVTNYQLNSLLGVAAIKLYLHFATGFDRVNTTGEFLGRPNRLIVKLGDNVAQLQSGEVGRTVVDQPMNLQPPSLCSGDTTTSSDISNAEKALVSWLDLGLKRRERWNTNPNPGGDRLLITIEFDTDFRAGFDGAQDAREFPAVAHWLIAKLDQHVARLDSCNCSRTIVAGQAGNKYSLRFRVLNIK